MNTDRRGDMELFLCGDVMTGRGIDQILPNPSDPALHENYVKDARDYIEIATEANGPVPISVNDRYIWGDALSELESRRPDARIINLETSITDSDDWQPKGINYRMNPRNVTCLVAAGVDCAALANNHVLDWGISGLEETLRTLAQAGIKTAGAGRSLHEAESPAVLEMAGKGRLLVFSLGMANSGIPQSWAAAERKPGVNFLEKPSWEYVMKMKEIVTRFKRKGDVAILSLHWGGNWGYEISSEDQRFAHELIDHAGIDLVHGHSSHHVKAFEVYRNKLILYGCGDFINDYEGIRGYEIYRPELAVMFFPRVRVATGELVDLQIVPLRIRNFRLVRASVPETRWLSDLLNRETRKLGNSGNPFRLCASS
ncbi:MAG: poly-gamma-glutamate biosynthesis protein [Bdellovibrionales bacterium GWB1_55_8]|nr:MAG: poly-gamma-glutamate biosynthesis protein [Bdellovibrionales bacterium GWB1_55_8]